MLESGTVVLTVGTYRREHFFRGYDRTKLLHGRLMEMVREQEWEARSWSVFSNHYHIVLSGIADPRGFSTVMRQFHGRLSHELNGIDGTRGRKVFHNYWDSNYHNEKSFLARMRYVMQNPVRHGLVKSAVDYPFCSAAWFERTEPRSFVATLESFKIDRVSIPDEFEPVWDADKRIRLS